MGEVGAWWKVRDAAAIVIRSVSDFDVRRAFFRNNDEAEFAETARYYLNGMTPRPTSRSALGTPPGPELSASRGCSLSTRLVGRRSIDAKPDPAVFGFFRQIVVPYES